MAIDPFDNSIWAVAWDQIYKLDTSGNATFIGLTGLNFGTTDLHFDANGNLYGTYGGGDIINDELILIDQNSRGLR